MLLIRYQHKGDGLFSWPGGIKEIDNYIGKINGAPASVVYRSLANKLEQPWWNGERPSPRYIYFFTEEGEKKHKELIALLLRFHARRGHKCERIVIEVGGEEVRNCRVLPIDEDQAAVDEELVEEYFFA